MRKKYSFYNMLGSLSSYAIATVLAFITQAVLVHILGLEYNGVNGLFNNIITMLSVAELGFASTIIFKLYEPLAKNDQEKIKSWMNFYKKCYRYVSLFIFVFGILLIPLIPIIVGETSINDNIILLYLITLFDTVLSYVMTYKRSLLYADQKNYIINIFHIGYLVIMNLLQILSIIIFKNYIIFLALKVGCRLFENIIINLYIDKKYPYINSEYIELSKNEKKDVFSRIKAILLQKISFVINKGIDNIIISLFLGLTSVGLYTNYYLVISSINTIIYQIISSFTASVGNLLTENDNNKNYLIYRRITLINSYITGVACVGFACCIEPLIRIWLGNEYILPNIITISFIAYIYTDSIRRSITIFKDAAGICKEDKYMYVLMALINLISSVALCKIIGMAGVIIGTALSYLFLIIYSYPKYIYKKVINNNIKSYFYLVIKNIIAIITSTIICKCICNNINIHNSIVQFVISAGISIVITSIVFIIIYKNNEEYIYFKNIIKERRR